MSADGERWQRDERIPPCPLAQALTYYLDVTTPPSQSLLHKLSKMAKQEEHRQRLLALATVSHFLTIKNVPKLLMRLANSSCSLMILLTLKVFF